MPPIPPPPLEAAPGPAVPPRRNMKRLNATGTQTLERQRRSGGGLYPDVEEEFEPQFLVQASDGSVFVPSGGYGQGQVTRGSQTAH